MLSLRASVGSGQKVCVCRPKAAVTTRPSPSRLVSNPISRRLACPAVSGEDRGAEGAEPEKQVLLGLTSGDAVKWVGLVASAYAVLHISVNASMAPLYAQLAATKDQNTATKELLEVKFNASEKLITATKEVLEVKLNHLKEGQDRLEKAQDRLEKAQDRLETVQDSLKESQDSIRESQVKMERVLSRVASKMGLQTD